MTHISGWTPEQVTIAGMVAALLISTEGADTYVARFEDGTHVDVSLEVLSLLALDDDEDTSLMAQETYAALRDARARYRS